jgi:hypothetical protein
MNSIAYLLPERVYRSDSCPHGLGGTVTKATLGNGMCRTSSSTVQPTLPHTTVFQYLTRRTYVVRLFYYMIFVRKTAKTQFPIPKSCFNIMLHLFYSTMQSVVYTYNIFPGSKKNFHTPSSDHRQRLIHAASTAAHSRQDTDRPSDPAHAA